jgi:hypothetical protein
LHGSEKPEEAAERMIDRGSIVVVTIVVIIVSIYMLIVRHFIRSDEKEEARLRANETRR